MVRKKRLFGGRLAAGIVLCLWNFATISACNRSPREPESLAPSVKATPPNETSLLENSSPQPPLPSCVFPLAEPPPPEARSVSDCPADVQGRPLMPHGKVKFLSADRAPVLDVEVALNENHRSHGLMFRPSLSDNEGMLFSWNDESKRSFWMRNTCMALDMLFIAQDGTIAGILEQVPPMNEASRSVPCPAAHVLEVRAGWTRTYGVTPGQKISIGL